MALPSQPLATEDALDWRVLLSRAVQGDGDAFGELCRPHEARLLRQAQWLTGDTAAADELAQDTLLAAWKSLPQFQGRSQFFTWLCSILLFQHRTRLRRELGLRRWFAPWSEAFGDGSTSIASEETVGGPDEQIVAREESERVRKCLLRLPEKHREVIFLRFYAGESLDGIASVLNLSVGTVKSRLFHALEKLRRMQRDFASPSSSPSRPPS